MSNNKNLYCSGWTLATFKSASELELLAKRIKSRIILDKYLASVPRLGETIVFDSLEELNQVGTLNFLLMKSISKRDYEKMYPQDGL